MDETRLRRTGALLASAAMLASLMAVTVAAPASAATPQCDGRSATITDNDGNDLDPRVGFITGTAGPDVIVGSVGSDVIEGRGGRDRICGGVGKDSLDGGAGNDRLFGGGGDDVLDGGEGKDDIFGYRGNDLIDGGKRKDFVKGGPGSDTIWGGAGPDVLKGNGGADWVRGGAGNDSINGGPGTDDCLQQGGTGPVRQCEKADLKVRINGPSDISEGTFEAKVKVRNLGPDASSYSLVLDDQGNENVGCRFDVENEAQRFGSLRPGATRTRTYPIDCELRSSGSGSFDLTVKVNADARDRRQSNNKDSVFITVN
jgi:Ca2+-binding RTX toxin-like protein